MIDFMAEDGYVGDYNGSKAREVMLTEEMWSNIQNGDPNPTNDEDWPEEDAPAAVAPAIKPKPAAKPSAKPTRPIASKRSEVDADLFDDETDDDTGAGKIEVAHSKSPSKVRRPKLKNLTKNLGMTSHTAANFVAPIADEPIEDDLEDDEEYEEDEYEEAEASVEDDDDEYEYEYEYEDEEDDEEEEDEYDEDEYEDVE